MSDFAIGIFSLVALGVLVLVFVLMGFLVSESGMGRDAFDVANAMFKRIKGGLGVGTIAANTIFAAIIGISIASTAVFTKIAVPELIRPDWGRKLPIWAMMKRRSKCWYSSPA